MKGEWDSLLEFERTLSCSKIEKLVGKDLGGEQVEEKQKNVKERKREYNHCIHWGGSLLNLQRKKKTVGRGGESLG